jgi:flagellar capping protein FliD
MPKYVTEGRLEGIMAGFQDQFRDFVMHFNKGQGILIQRFENVDKRLDGIDVRLNSMEERNNQRFEGIERRFEVIDQRFVEVNSKLDLLM